VSAPAREPRPQRGVIVNRVSEAVGRQRLTLTALARLAGLGRDTVSDLYRDKTRQITFSTLAALCQALEVQPGDLFAYRPPPDRRAGGARRSARSP
jgi:putative transcriptional regulator